MKGGGPAIFGRTELPRFLVTIDTEEAFDWNAPFRRDGHSVDHIASLQRFQTIAERHGVKPVYLIDFPVASDGAAREYFGGLQRAGRAFVGAHLHPWNTPPFDEELTRPNSYGCNLSPELEQRKLDRLLEAIEMLSGATPLIFRAGRYGAGSATMQALRARGIAFDSSVRPLFDYRGDGGPDFSGAPSKPYWHMAGEVAELPVTSVFTGLFHSLGRHFHGADSGRHLFRGPLARMRLLSRTPLTPEGIDLGEAKKGVDRAIAARLPLLVFSFHSPSVVPGNTAYVQSEDEADRFHHWWDAMFGHLAERGVAAADLSDLHHEIFGPYR